MTRKCVSCCFLRCFGVDYVLDPLRYVLLSGEAFESSWAGTSFVPSPSFTRELLSVRVLMCIVLFLCLPIGRTVLPLNTGLKFRDRQVHHILTGGGPEFAALDLPQGKPERMWRCMISRVNNLNHGSEVERDGLDPICAFNASHALPRRVAVPFLSRTVVFGCCMGVNQRLRSRLSRKVNASLHCLSALRKQLR